MKVNNDVLAIGSLLNDMCDSLPKGRGDCFDVGSWGGCGVDCPVFCRGDCDEPQEILADDVIDYHDDDAVQILELYSCYDDAVEKIKGESK